MTPDSTPVVGHTHFQNLFINAGHGTLGWTMACGSGKLISDLMTGHKTEISTDGLDISRYQSGSKTHYSAGRPNIIHA
jgi:D-amino-acid dehydrogenase